jgi:hypothetical protein
MFLYKLQKQIQALQDIYEDAESGGNDSIALYHVDEDFISELGDLMEDLED